MLLEWLNSIYYAIFSIGWISNAFWNILISVFGIIFTVFFVDRRAKKREDERWQPAKGIVNSKVFSELLRIVYLLNPKTANEKDFRHYQFGPLLVATPYDVTKLKNADVTISGNKLKGLNHLSIKTLVDVNERIDKIINDFPQLIDPELLSMLIYLQEIFPIYIDKFNHYLNIENDDREGSIDTKILSDWVIDILLLLTKKTLNLKIKQIAWFQSLIRVINIVYLQE